ncbi:MAG TPA: hydroxymethylbilane synthase [Thermoanaerobaculia bacterium]|nr:hydroxymethylbilane synthase [Thermoanaerobaculia bacterium]
MTIVRIGTRGSPLALWQANETARLLRDAGFAPEIVEIRTTGDRRVDVPLAAIGGKGLFVKELEEALDRGEIDVAVHSLKDVPSIIPERFALFGFLERGDPRDAWLQPHGLPIAALPTGAVVATSAPRRRAQLLERHPHLNVVAIRGNVDTRIARMQDGLVLARAGLVRLGRAHAIVSTFDVDEMVPAAGQGIVALEALRTSVVGRDAAEAINHPRSALAARCERAVLQQFGTILDCTSCVAVHASFDGDAIVVRAFVSDFDGTSAVRVTHRGIDAEKLVRSVASDLRAGGALPLLERRAS